MIKGEKKTLNWACLHRIKLSMIRRAISLDVG